MFGQIDEINGDLIADTDICVLTGQPIETGDAMIRLSGTPYFVRVKSDQVKNVTPEVLAALRSQLPQPEAEYVVVADVPAEEVPLETVTPPDEPFRSSRRRGSDSVRTDEENT